MPVETTDSMDSISITMPLPPDSSSLGLDLPVLIYRLKPGDNYDGPLPVMKKMPYREIINELWPNYLRISDDIDIDDDDS